MQSAVCREESYTKVAFFYTKLENIRVDQAVHNDAGSGSEDDVLWDNDNEIEDGDADLFEDLVSSHMNVVKDNKKANGSKLKTLAISRLYREVMKRTLMMKVWKPNLSCWLSVIVSRIGLKLRCQEMTRQG